MKTFSATIRNTRGNDINFKPVLSQSAVVREQMALLRSAEDMAYALFDYTPAAWTPDFPAVAGRMAWVNGRYTYTPDTSVTYRRGRRVVTEWHALAGVRS